MKTGLGIATLLVAFLLVGWGGSAHASPGDFDGDGILDRYDARPRNPFRAPLGGISTSKLKFSLESTSSSAPTVAYVESFGATAVSLVSADIRSGRIGNTRAYAGPVMITKARVRNLARLDVDADVMIGATLNTHATATAPNGAGALVRGHGLCVSIKKLNRFVADIEQGYGREVTLFNLAEALDKARSVLSNLDFGACSFVLAVKHGGKFWETHNKRNPLFPGVGRADRITADVWGAANWTATGWRVPFRLRIPGIVSFANGRLRIAP